jgi:hypothetical protein
MDLSTIAQAVLVPKTSCARGTTLYNNEMQLDMSKEFEASVVAWAWSPAKSATIKQIALTLLCLRTDFTEVYRPAKDAQLQSRD